MAVDRIVCVVLKDGTIKSTTDAISGANHNNAEGFFELLKQRLGGEEVRESRGQQGHEHSHSHTHEYEGGGGH